MFVKEENVLDDHQAALGFRDQYKLVLGHPNEY